MWYTDFLFRSHSGISGLVWRYNPTRWWTEVKEEWHPPYAPPPTYRVRWQKKRECMLRGQITNAHREWNKMNFHESYSNWILFKPTINYLRTQWEVFILHILFWGLYFLQNKKIHHNKVSFAWIMAEKIFN